MRYVIFFGSTSPYYKNEREHGVSYKGWIRTTRGTEIKQWETVDINEAHCQCGVFRSDVYYHIEEVP